MYKMRKKKRNEKKRKNPEKKQTRNVSDGMEGKRRRASFVFLSLSLFLSFFFLFGTVRPINLYGAHQKNNKNGGKKER